MKYLIFLILLSGFVSCNTSNNKVLADSKVLVADNIVYDVVIKVPDLENSWEVEKLEGYFGEKMVSEIFNAVYTEKITAYDYHTGKKLSPDEIRKTELEPGFDRNNLGKIEFTEKWYYDPVAMKLEKEITSMVLGYENRTINGILIGYKAAFKLEMK